MRAKIGPPADSAPVIRYVIRIEEAAAHCFGVTLTVLNPAPAGQKFALPAWIPGSYLIREFAKHLGRVQAWDAHGQPVALNKIDKHTWQAAPCAGTLQLEYAVYAADPSVRSAYLDQTYGFFNGSSLCLRVLQQEQSLHVLEIQRPQATQSSQKSALNTNAPDTQNALMQDWQITTALTPLSPLDAKVFGRYYALDYASLIDHPVVLGKPLVLHFDAQHIPHRIALIGHVLNLDTQRLLLDLQKFARRKSLFLSRNPSVRPCQIIYSWYSSSRKDTAV